MLNETFAALSDPTRRQILNLLSVQELSVGEVVDEFTLTQSAISRHLNVLEGAKLIERRREGQKRVCTLQANALIEVDDWIDRYRHHWHASLSRLEKAVAKSKTKKTKK